MSDLERVVERATRTIGRMVVTVAQLMDMHPGVRVHLTDDGWYCDEVTHSVWFGVPFLWEDPQCTVTRAPPRRFPAPSIPPWTITPGYIRLDARNGTWIWRLTDQFRDGANTDGQVRYRLGVWPD